MYQESRSAIDGAVSWQSWGGGDTRVLPDGCLDLLWFGDHLLVAGPDTRAYVSTSGPAAISGLRLPPGVGPRVFGVPASELRDRRVRLDTLWPSAQVRRLSEQVASAADPGALLERIAGHRLADAPADPLMQAVADLLASGASVGSVAAAVSLGERQLHRRSLAAFGYGPKTLARILRLRRALALTRAGVPAVDAGLRAGYADQAHLARDVRALTGTTLTGLLS